MDSADLGRRLWREVAGGGGVPLQTQGHGQWERRQAHSRGRRGSQVQSRKVMGTFQDEAEDEGGSVHC